MHIHAAEGIMNQPDYGRIVAWMQSIIDALFPNAHDDPAERMERREFATARSAQLFAQALRENSMIELNWLWYAAQMDGTIERRYCLHRALAINPHSSLAHGALAQLPKHAGGEIVELSRAIGAIGPLYR